MTTVSELVSDMMPSSHAGVKGCTIRVGVRDNQLHIYLRNSTIHLQHDRIWKGEMNV